MQLDVGFASAEQQSLYSEILDIEWSVEDESIASLNLVEVPPEASGSEEDGGEETPEETPEPEPEPEASVHYAAQIRAAGVGQTRVKAVFVSKTGQPVDPQTGVLYCTVYVLDSLPLFVLENEGPVFTPGFMRAKTLSAAQEVPAALWDYAEIEWSMDAAGVSNLVLSDELPTSVIVSSKYPNPFFSDPGENCFVKATLKLKEGADAALFNGTGVFTESEFLITQNLPQYHISYNSNWTAGEAGGGSAMANSGPHIWNQNVPLTTNTYTQKGWHFLGWMTEEEQLKEAAAEGSGAVLAGGTPLNLTYIGGTTVPVYAKWGRNTYSVRFYKNSSSSDNVYTEQSTFTYGVAKDINTFGSMTSLARTGWTFSGWATSRTGTVVRTDANRSVSKLDNADGTAPGNNGHLDLYAISTANTYKVKYYYNNNGAADTKDYTDPTNYSYGTNATIKSNSALTSWTKNDYTFQGWANEAGSQTVKYAKTGLTNLTAPEPTPIMNGTLNLYSIWSQDLYKVTAAAVTGGSVNIVPAAAASTSTGVAPGTSVTITVTPTNDDYLIKTAPTFIKTGASNVITGVSINGGAISSPYGTKSWTFSMPAYGVTVTPSYENDPKKFLTGLSSSVAGSLETVTADGLKTKFAYNVYISKSAALPSVTAAVSSAGILQYQRLGTGGDAAYLTAAGVSQTVTPVAIATPADNATENQKIKFKVSQTNPHYQAEDNSVEYEVTVYRIGGIVQTGNNAASVPVNASASVYNTWIAPASGYYKLKAGGGKGNSTTTTDTWQGGGIWNTRGTPGNGAVYSVYRYIAKDAQINWIKGAGGVASKDAMSPGGAGGLSYNQNRTDGFWIHGGGGGGYSIIYQGTSASPAWHITAAGGGGASGSSSGGSSANAGGGKGGDANSAVGGSGGIFMKQWTASEESNGGSGTFSIAGDGFISGSGTNGGASSGAEITIEWYGLVSP